MPRSARLDAHGVLHYVTDLGIEKRQIFITDGADRYESIACQNVFIDKRYLYSLFPSGCGEIPYLRNP
jgi:hypothetical protein